MGVSHCASGVAVGALVGQWAPTPGVGVGCAVAGGLAGYLPDLDHGSSTATRLLVPAAVLVVVVGLVVWPPPVAAAAGLVVGSASWLVRAASRAVGLPAHRGLSHTVLAAAVCAGVAGWVAAWWLPPPAPVVLGVAAGGGYAAALAGDWVTRASLPLLWWPWHADTPGPPKALRIRAGGPVERLVIFPVLCVAAALGVAALIGGAS